MALSQEKGSAGHLSKVAVLISIIALAVAIFSLLYPRDQKVARQTGESPPSGSSLDRIKRARTIRAGYSGFRPYTIVNLDAKDPNARITGFCVDMLNEIARRQSPPWKIEWHQVTFETLRADMDSGRFDVFADAVYQTAPRAAEFGSTIPYSYFGVAVAVVRKGDNRFSSFSSLDRPDITISLAEGWTSTEYARQELSKPKFKVIPVADDPFITLQEVIAGRADVALQDIPTVVQFAREHKDQVDALWLDQPPTRVPAGFMTRKGDWELLHFLDVSIRVLEADGTMEKLDKKWQALSEFPVLDLRSGYGLTQ